MHYRKFIYASLSAVALTVVIPSLVSATSSVFVDFDAALTGLGFPPAATDGNGDAFTGPNGMLDSAELAVVAEILADNSLDLTGTGGIDHDTVHTAWNQAIASASIDLAPLTGTFPTAPTAMAGYAMLGANSFAAANALSTFFGAPMTGNYSLAVALDPFLGPIGDADGDGFTNQQEYNAFFLSGTAAYVAAALDPTVALAIVTSSGAGTYPVGSDVTLSVTLTNTSGDETFQWQADTGSGFQNLSDGGAISGAFTDTLVIDPVGYPDAGTYRVVITNSLGVVTGSGMAVNVVASVPAASGRGIAILALMVALTASAVLFRRRLAKVV